MSFINLLANDVWSEADIVNRTEAMIASEFSPNAVAILNRKVTAATIGQYVLTLDEQMEVGRYAAVCNAAAAAGNEARADMALLSEVMSMEADQALVASGPDAISLYELRNPVVPEELVVPEEPVVVPDEPEVTTT